MKACDRWDMLDLVCPTFFEEEKERKREEDPEADKDEPRQFDEIEIHAFDRIKKEKEVKVPRAVSVDQALMWDIHRYMRDAADEAVAEAGVPVEIPVKVKEPHMIDEEYRRVEEQVEVLFPPVFHSKPYNTWQNRYEYIKKMRALGYTDAVSKKVIERAALTGSHLGNSIRWANTIAKYGLGRVFGLIPVAIVSVLAYWAVRPDDVEAIAKEKMTELHKAGRLTGPGEATWYIPESWRGSDYPGILG